MASSLGNAFGVAISSTVYSVLAAQLNLSLGGFMGVIFNAIVALLALVAILFLVRKNNQIYKNHGWRIGHPFSKIKLTENLEKRANVH